MPRQDYESTSFTPQPYHYTALHLLMVGNSAREVATQMDQPTADVVAFAKGWWCQEQIKTIHDKFVANVQKRLFDPMATFYEKLPDKITQLDVMSRSENESVALRAIELWVSHTLGSPVKRSELKVEGTIAHMSLEELRFIREHGRLPTETEKLELTAPSIDAEYIEH